MVSTTALSTAPSASNERCLRLGHRRHACDHVYTLTRRHRSPASSHRNFRVESTVASTFPAPVSTRGGEGTRESRLPCLTRPWMSFTRPTWEGREPASNATSERLDVLDVIVDDDEGPRRRRARARRISARAGEDDRAGKRPPPETTGPRRQPTGSDPCPPRRPRPEATGAGDD